MKWCTCLLLFSASYIRASEHYALLIGISHYIPNQRLVDLEGPAYDVEAMAKSLADFGYQPANITVLRDAQASKAGILGALDNIIDRVAPGDYFFIYYSGHGTSPQDLASRNLPIDIDSGAIYPADFRLGTPQEIVERLIVGRRDLRSRLQRLDGKATVFGLLDTCFSANLMKSVKLRGTPKSVPLWQVMPATRSMEETIAHELAEDQKAAAYEAPFPYKTVAWISAALAGQQAVDLDSRTLKDDPDATIDKKPHGALTNAVLAGLKGPADRNHDGVITHSEMYEFLVQSSKTWSHQPAWSASESERTIPSMPLLGSRGLAYAYAPTKSRGTVRVKLDEGAAVLRQKLAGEPRIELVSSQADLIVSGVPGSFLLSQAGGVPLFDKAVDTDTAVARVLAEPDVQALLEMNYSRQRVNVELSVWHGNERSRMGFYRPTRGQGDPNNVHVKIKADRQVWPLIVNIDTTGYGTVLYPRKERAVPIDGGELIDLGENSVQCRPCGIEYIKAFVFDTKPTGWESWAGQEFQPSDARLQRLLTMARTGAGETTLRIITNDSN